MGSSGTLQSSKAKDLGGSSRKPSQSKYNIYGSKRGNNKKQQQKEEDGINEQLLMRVQQQREARDNIYSNPKNKPRRRKPSK